MNNKYNLDFYEATECMNDYLDMLEDNFNHRFNEQVGNEELLTELRQGKITLNNEIQQSVLDGKFQEAFNTLTMYTLYEMFTDIVMEGKGDMTYITDYVESTDEELMINDVTEYFNQILS